jgi:hypothetical protein
LTTYKGATPFRFNDIKRFPFYELFILTEEEKRDGGKVGVGGGGRWEVGGGGRGGGGEGEVGEERKRE